MKPNSILFKIGNLRCPTCGGETFEGDDDHFFLRCERCGREFIGGVDELQDYNKMHIEKRVNSIVEEAWNKAIKKTFKK